ncbi:MAG: hypothetical protein ING19_01440 [Azospirillum sp.]|nr:hypothetical protein [Azospirillum sp.]MCA3264705.1 hypothetical protein [Azospirillum sp.]
MLGGVSALGLAGIVGAIVGYGYWTYDLPKSKVSVTIQANSANCKDPKFPLFVGVVNNSSRRVLGYTVYPMARLPGRSTNIAENIEPFSSDYIIEAGEGVGLCFAAVVKSYRTSDIQARLGELEWGVDSFTVRFDGR